jgi:ferritin
MISVKMAKALNDQLNLEFASSYAYLAMAVYFEDRGLKGMSAWMQGQAREEWGHGMKIYNYLFEQGSKPELQTIKSFPSEFESVRHTFEQALRHEQHVTKSISSLMDQAIDEKDHATRVFLNWFVEEQVEEEASVQDILTRLEYTDDKGPGIIFLDKELGARGE